MAAGMGDMVMFIAAVMAAAGMSGIIISVASDYGDAVEKRLGAQTLDLEGSIAIVNDPQAMQFDPLVLYAMNTGARSLVMTDLVVLIDGVAQATLSIDVLQSSDDFTLGPGLIAEITVTVTLAAGDHIVQILTSDGEQASFEFFSP